MLQTLICQLKKLIIHIIDDQLAKLWQMYFILSTKAYLHSDCKIPMSWMDAFMVNMVISLDGLVKFEEKKATLEIKEIALINKRYISILKTGENWRRLNTLLLLKVELNIVDLQLMSEFWSSGNCPIVTSLTKYLTKAALLRNNQLLERQRGGRTKTPDWWIVNNLLACLWKVDRCCSQKGS